jgi:hypothetical protein
MALIQTDTGDDRLLRHSRASGNPVISPLILSKNNNMTQSITGSPPEFSPAEAGPGTTLRPGQDFQRLVLLP